MAEAVYLLCAVTSVVCAALLWSGYRRSRTRLLLWSAIGFAGFAVNNLLVVVDLVLVPEVDLALARSAVAVASMVALLHGLIAREE
jgi:hypothetical protein